MSNQNKLSKLLAFFKVIGIAIVVAVVGILLAVSVFSPTKLNFNKAKKLMKKGDYAEAYYILADLGAKDYAPAEKLLKDYNVKYETLTVTSTMRNGDYVIKEENKYEYTEKGDPLSHKVIDEKGNIVSTAKWEYNEEGFMTLYVRYDQKDNLTDRTEYDGKGNVTLSVSYHPNGNLKSRTEYDANGNMTMNVSCDEIGNIQFKESYMYTYDANGKTAGATYYSKDLIAYKTKHEYHSNGELSAVIRYDPKDCLLRRDEYNENGMPTLCIFYDENGNVSKKTEFDEKGNKTADLVYTPGGDVFQKTEYLYNDDGNLTLETYYDENNAAHVMTECEFNKKGVKISETRYSLDGTMLSKTEYDKKGKLLLSVSYDSNGSVSEESKWEYDEYGNQNVYTYTTFSENEAYVAERSEFDYYGILPFYSPKEK